MENRGIKPEGMTIKEGALELCIDHDHITISVDRFSELITKEVQLGMVEQFYLQSESYELQGRLASIFGPVPKKDDDNA